MTLAVTADSEQLPLITAYNRNERFTADFYGVDVETVRGWRKRGLGPRYKKINGKARSGPAGDAINDTRLTDELACRVMGWRVAPDRYIKSGRRWIPKWRFQPLADLSDAFQLLDHVAHHYILTSDRRVFSAEVRIGASLGTASGDRLARAIATAVATAVGLTVGEQGADHQQSSRPPKGRR